MVLKRIIAKILRKRPPEELFAEARDLFAEHDYRFAYALFKKAEKGFSGIDPEMEQKSAISAATCASFLDREHEAGQHLFRAARLSLSLKHPLSDTIHLVDKAAKAMLSTEDAKPTEVGQILAALFMSHLANNDLSRARKVATNPTFQSARQISRIIEELDHLVQERSTLLQSYEINWSFLPEEFLILSRDVHDVLNGYIALNPVILPPKLERIDVKQPIEVIIELSSSQEIRLKHFSLRTGTKGAVLNRPRLDSEEALVSPNKPRRYSFLVEAHLPGEWCIGPAILGYEASPNLQFEIETDTFQIMVNEPTPVLHCEMKLVDAPKAHECRLIVELRNDGPGTVENLQMALSIPEGLSLIDGTLTKQLASLAPSQSFSYDLGLRSDIALNMLSGKELLVEINHAPVKGTTRLTL